MPFFTLHRNHTLRTTKGFSVTFVKDEPAWVPPAGVPDAIAIGAIPQDKEVDVLGDDSAVVVQEISPEQRKAKLFEAFHTMLSRNVRGDFGANGLPANRKLESLCGFEVSNRERDTAWQEYSHRNDDQ
jgi:hypothetical protein